MTDGDHTSLGGTIKRKPLQAGKFISILLSLVLGVAGFFRFIDVRALVENPTIGDGQFLSLVLIPLISIALVCLVFIETVVTGYRMLRSDDSLTDQLANRTGYLLIRIGEAAIAVFGVAIMAIALPPLFADSTTAPAGVGILLLLMAVGLGILVMSLIRSAVELFVFSGT